LLLELVGLSDAKGKGIHQRAEEKPEISMAINVGLRLPVPLPLSPKFYSLDEPAAGMNPNESTSVSAYEKSTSVQPDCDLN